MQIFSHQIVKSNSSYTICRHSWRTQCSRVCNALWGDNHILKFFQCVRVVLAKQENWMLWAFLWTNLILPIAKIIYYCFKIKCEVTLPSQRFIDKTKCWACLSQGQSNQRYKIKWVAELWQLPACFENTAWCNEIRVTRHKYRRNFTLTFVVNNEIVLFECVENTGRPRKLTFRSEAVKTF